MSRTGKANANRVFGQKRHRRQWLAFVRMCRYGINNFSRNAWLTVAATAVMTITLLIVFMTVVAQTILQDTTVVVGKRIERSIYLKTGTTQAEAKPIVDDLQALSNVDTVTFVSTEEGKEELADKNKSNAGTINALTQASNKIPAKVSVTLKDINDTSQLVKYVKEDDYVKKYMDPNRKPTFMSDRKVATETIASWTRTAQQLGIVMSVLFMSISILIIFNTIRMAIFNRKEEIQMMKLIGADRSFIRGPFVVEAIVYGFIAAVVATGVGLTILTLTADQMASYGIAVGPTIEFITTYIGFVLLAMIVLGALVGTLSSLLATRRYLKI